MKAVSLTPSILLAGLLLSSCSLPGGEAAAEAQGIGQPGKKTGQRILDNDRFKVRWTLDGDDFKIRLESSYKGYMALGFNPKPSMTGADMIIVRMGQSGKISVEDHFCRTGKVHKPDKELGGTSRIKKKSGGTKDGWTTADITIAARSDDPNDVSIESGKKYYFLVSASNKSSMLSMHTFVDKFLVIF
jgi:hypothetical protein